MRDRIWTELTQAKHNIEFASLYAERQRSILRYFNIGVLVFSSGGVMGWSIWELIPIIACGFIAFVSILRLIQPHIIMNDKQIINLESINKFYFEYYNKLEKLWYDIEQKSIDLGAAKEIFFEIKHSEAEVNTLVNETIRTKPKSLVKKANIYSTQYFKLSFKTATQ